MAHKQSLTDQLEDMKMDQCNSVSDRLWSVAGRLIIGLVSIFCSVILPAGLLFFIGLIGSGVGIYLAMAVGLVLPIETDKLVIIGASVGGGLAMALFFLIVLAVGQVACLKLRQPIDPDC